MDENERRCFPDPVRTTVDSLLQGELLLEQPAPGLGYRFNEDAVLLARFATAGCNRVEHLLDLGAGVGAIALSASRLTCVASMTLVDSDAQMCALARRNLERAGVAAARVVESDVAQLTPETGLADLIVMNPPYTEHHAGRPSAVAGRDLARRGRLAPFIEAAARLLADSGRACVCQPAGALVGLLRAIEEAGLHARRGVFVFPPGDKPARLILLELSRSPGEFVLAP